MGIGLQDTDKHAAAVLRNWEFFRAPLACIVCMHRDLSPWDAMSVGMFVQTLLLALTERGLSSCVEVVASMARLSVGPSWSGLSEAQRQEVTESYGRYISAIYADRFDSYNGQKLEVTGEQPAAFGLMVKSRIIKSNGEPVEVDYVMRQNGESWLIADIYLDSAISEVATRRSEFAAILKAQGIDGLSRRSTARPTS
jgi:ABC-type transporter MlaC component